MTNEEFKLEKAFTDNGFSLYLRPVDEGYSANFELSWDIMDEKIVNEFIQPFTIDELCKFIKEYTFDVYTLNMEDIEDSNKVLAEYKYYMSKIQAVINSYYS